MGIEDQKEEREVLESIFPDEITGTPPQIATASPIANNTCADVSETEFRVAIQLDDGRHEDEEREDEQRTPSYLSGILA
jgi:very-short-patch-repair endonuclease